ncbi:MAG: DUF3987 domain-containing protein [Phycisphaerales bacterium]|nr:DUF3987 domain-containing protein [Phycisphaerales bacterium]
MGASITEQVSMVDAAVRLGARGFRVFPVRARDKTPLIKDWPNRASADEKVIREWWNNWPDANIGIATGASGIVVIDIDPRHGGDESFADLCAKLGPLPETVMSMTGGGGQYFFFRAPQGAEIESKNKVRGYSGVDVKAVGGYVVAPPSIHPSGRAYAWEVEHDPTDGYPLAELPNAWIEFLPQKGRAAAPRADNGPTDGAIQEGSRNATLTKIAGAMRRHGSSVETIRAALLAENAKRCVPPLSEAEVAGIAGSVARYDPAASMTATPPRPWASFPTELLPKPVERFVTATADALGCDPAMVALPTLSVLGSAIGTARVIALKGSWTEPPVTWACVVARSGTLKSPAMDAAVKPLHAAQIAALNEYKSALEEFETAKLWYEKRKSEWVKKGKASEPPEKPETPVCVRFTVADTTIEALASILSDNSRGVLVARDELAGWVRSFNQYKAKGGADAAGWLELWRAGTLIVDRKTGNPRTIYVPRAAASVCGTIQPGTLANTLTAEHFESGLAARLLLAKPPERIKKWSNRVPSADTVAGFERIVGAMLKLQPGEGEHAPEPVRVPLASDAEPVWAEWFDLHARRIIDAASDNESAALAKLEAYAPRFALIFTLADNPTAATIGADAIRRGCALADWFANEAERVYGALAESGEDRERRQLVEWIRRRGDAVTVRELTHGTRRFRGRGDAAREALNGLALAGLGAWRNDGARDGRPSELFHLNPVTETRAADGVTGVTVTETPAGAAGNDGFGDGDGGDGVQPAIFGDDAEPSIDEMNRLADDAGDADREGMV